MTPAAAVGVDLGGTNLRVALVEDGQVRQRVSVPHPGDDVDALVASIVGTAAEVGGGLPLGVGVAGLVGQGRFVHGPNLPLPPTDLAEILTRAYGQPVVVGNDATLATLAEWQVGAGRGADEMVMVTVGTGIGGGLVVGGRLVGGAHGFAGELGHLVVVAGGRPCACGNEGCLEAYASGTGVARSATERLASAPSSSLAGPGPVTGRDVQTAADAGDDLAALILDEAGELLGVALVGIANLLDPEVIVLGGGAGSAASPRWIPLVQHAIDRGVLGAGRRSSPVVRVARLGDDAGTVGAALAAADPTLLSTGRTRP